MDKQVMSNDFINVNDYIEILKIIELESKEMFSNTNYLKWLENFTSEHQSFTDSFSELWNGKISNEDSKNISNLSLLYNGIERYAKKNYIYPTKCDFGSYYNIKLNNISYEIGMLVGQGSIFFCNRKPISKDLEYIDFTDIMVDKKKDGVDEITQQLKDLSDKILELHKKGIPLNALIETLNTTLIGIKEEKNPTKTLKIN